MGFSLAQDRVILIASLLKKGCSIACFVNRGPKNGSARSVSVPFHALHNKQPPVSLLSSPSTPGHHRARLGALAQETKTTVSLQGHEME